MTTPDTHPLFYRLHPASRYAVDAWLFWYIAAHHTEATPELLARWRFLPYR